MFAAWKNRLRQQLRSQPHPLQQNPYHRLQTTADIQQAVQMGVCIDVNQASVDDWLRLPGISIRQARSLVQLSQSGVQFHCLDDLAAALGVSLQQLQPLQPLLRFCYYNAASVVSPCLLNVNQASVEQLTQVPAIDLYLARLIVQRRQRQGRFQNIADLQQQLSLPASLTADLMHYLRF